MTYTALGEPVINIPALEASIKNATTTPELEAIVKALPKRANGCRTSLQGLLDDAFWYVDLVTPEQQKQCMLNRLAQQ